MKNKIENEGNYELFQTTKGHQILNLNDKIYFAVIQGSKGDILVSSDSDHQKEKTLKKGKFYLASFNDDPEFNDIPHLFLQEGNKYREWILPNDKPSEKDYQKKLVKTGDLVDKAKVEKHVKAGTGKGGDKKSSGSLSSKSKKELTDMARKRGIRGRSKMKKDQLINELK